MDLTANWQEYVDEDPLTGEATPPDGEIPMVK